MKKRQRQKKISIDRSMKQLLLLGAIVILFRLFYVDVYSGLTERFDFVLTSFVLDIFRNPIALIILLLCNFFFAKHISRSIAKKDNPLFRIILIFSYVIAISIVVTVIVNFNRIGEGGLTQELLWGYLKLTFMAAILINIILTIIPIVFIYYVQSSRQALLLERNKKEKARFQYNQLKRQLNPHFLFNSLNIVDCLVYTHPERASAFINKLAGVYRYMLSKESDAFVTLREELDFMDLYVDLLKERFAKGFEIKKTINAESLEMFVIPCSIQVLIENAVKHNVVAPEQPLTITISIEDGWLGVHNNLQPKLSVPERTGSGLNNINGQYKNVFGKEIVVTEGDSFFEVKIPLVTTRPDI